MAAARVPRSFAEPLDDGGGCRGDVGGSAHHPVVDPGLGKASTGHRLADYLSFLVGAVTRLAVAPRQDVVVALTSPPYTLLGGRGPSARSSANARRLLVPRRLSRRGGGVRDDPSPAASCRACCDPIQRWLLRKTDHVIALDDAMLRRTLASAG